MKIFGVSLLADGEDRATGSPSGGASPARRRGRSAWSILSCSSLAALLWVSAGRYYVPFYS